MSISLQSQRLILPILTLLFSFSSLFGHSYNIVEMVGPDEDRTFLLIKDNHELANIDDNLEELKAIKRKLIFLNHQKVPTLVLTESMWMYGHEFTKQNVQEAINHLVRVLAPNFKGHIHADVREFQQSRQAVAYIDIPLPLEIASLGTGTIRGESIDPRLPLLKMSRLLQNVSAKNIKISVQDIWDLVDNANAQLKEIDFNGENTEFFDVDERFWHVTENLYLQVQAFELVLQDAIPRDDSRVKTLLTKKNLKKILNAGEIKKLLHAVDLRPEVFGAHSWVQDIATIKRILEPKVRENIILVGGGKHLDLVQEALVGMGCTVKNNTGVSTEEILNKTNSQESVLSVNYTNIDKVLHENLLESIDSAFKSLKIEEDSSEEIEIKTAIINESTQQTIPTLTIHRCEGPNCDEIAPHACSACGKVFYCSRECQKAHWAKHKLDCKKK